MIFGTGVFTALTSHFGERARHLKLDSGSEGIADGQTEEGSTLTID
jgi:hypothetical protein